MNWGNIELEEITDIDSIDKIDLPKKMVVWSNDGVGIDAPCVRKVLAIVKDNIGAMKVIAAQFGKTPGVAIWNKCAEIPEEPKIRRATNRELAKWLADGNGEMTEGDICNGPFCKSSLYYESSKSNEKCSIYIYVRKWCDTEWHEPTIDYIGLEVK